jgi:hypothetical protein
MHHANISLLVHSVDHVNKEPDLKVQAEETNPKPDQGKPRCITLKSLTFMLINIFMLRMIVH